MNGGADFLSSEHRSRGVSLPATPVTEKEETRVKAPRQPQLFEEEKKASEERCQKLDEKIAGLRAWLLENQTSRQQPPEEKKQEGAGGYVRV